MHFLQSDNDEKHICATRQTANSPLDHGTEERTRALGSEMFSALSLTSITSPAIAGYGPTEVTEQPHQSFSGHIPNR